jgi:hypothetical protein
MMRLPRRAALLLAVAHLSSACGGADAQPPATPNNVSATPSAQAAAPLVSSTVTATTPLPSRWKRYVSAPGGFDLLMPCDSPEEQVHIGGAPSDGFSFESHILSCPRTKPNETMYGVEYWTNTKIPDGIEVALTLDLHRNSTRDESFARFYGDNLKQVMEGHGEGLKGALNDLAAKDGFAGEELHVTSPAGNRITQRLWVKLPRVISMNVINEEMGSDAENKAFLESLVVH